MTDASDAQLVQETLGGSNTAAFQMLVERYQGRVYALACALVGDRTEAQDLAQETFIRAYARLGQLREKEKLAGWLRRITFSTCMEWLRARRPEVFLSARDVDELFDESESPIDAIERSEIRQNVTTAINQLPARYRIALTMFHLDQQSHESVAEFLEIPVGTLKSLLSRGREMLKPALSAYDEEVDQMIDSTTNSKLPEDFSARVVALLDAVNTGDAKRVTELAQLDSSLLEARNADNATAINLAAHRGDRALVELLIKLGANPIEAAHWAHYGKPRRHDALVELLRAHVREDQNFKRLERQYAQTEASGEDWRVSQLVVKETPAITYLVYKTPAPIPANEIQAQQDRFFALVAELRKAMPVPQVGPNTFFYRQTSDSPQQWMFETGFAVPNDFAAPLGELSVKKQPPMRFAGVLLCGGYRHIGEGWNSLKRQLTARGESVDWSTAREIYHYMEAFDSPENRTEIQLGLIEK